MAAEVSSDGHIDTAFLDTVLANIQTTWTSKVQLNGIDTIFKLDTVAEVTAISEDSFQCLGRLVLTKPDRMLYGPSKQPLNVKGRFEGTFRYKGCSVQQPVFVVKGLKTNLLGLLAITWLNLAARIDHTTDAGAE